jgi:hypothetical protein
MRLSRPLVPQRDLVRWGDGVGLNGSESFAKALASLTQEPERVGGRTPWGSALRVGPVLLDEMGLKGRGDFIGCLKRMVDGPVPSSVVNHAANVNTPADDDGPGHVAVPGPSRRGHDARVPLIGVNGAEFCPRCAGADAPLVLLAGLGPDVPR